MLVVAVDHPPQGVGAGHDGLGVVRRVGPRRVGLAPQHAVEVAVQGQQVDDRDGTVALAADEQLATVAPPVDHGRAVPHGPDAQRGIGQGRTPNVEPARRGTDDALRQRLPLGLGQRPRPIGRQNAVIGRRADRCGRLLTHEQHANGPGRHLAERLAHGDPLRRPRPIGWVRDAREGDRDAHDQHRGRDASDQPLLRLAHASSHQALNSAPTRPSGGRGGRGKDGWVDGWRVGRQETRSWAPAAAGSRPSIDHRLFHTSIHSSIRPSPSAREFRPRPGGRGTGAWSCRGTARAR